MVREDIAGGNRQNPNSIIFIQKKSKMLTKPPKGFGIKIKDKIFPPTMKIASIRQNVKLWSFSAVKFLK